MPGKELKLSRRYLLSFLSHRENTGGVIIKPPVGRGQTLARAGGWCTPLWVFSNGRRTPGRIALQFYIAYGASFAQILANQFSPGQVRWPSYGVKEVQSPTDCSRKSCFQPRDLLPFTGMGHYAWFRSAHEQMWPVILHNDFPKVIRDHWPWLTPYIPIYG